MYQIENFSSENSLKINESQSNVLYFNPAKKFDFPQKISFSSGKPLEVLNSYKLVGVVIAKDLKWKRNTEAIYQTVHMHDCAHMDIGYSHCTIINTRERVLKHKSAIII